MSGNQTEKSSSSPSSLSPLWAFIALALPGTAAWYWTGDWRVALGCGLTGVFLLYQAGRELSRKIQAALFVELELFLIRCRLLPDDTRVLRNLPLSEMGRKRREWMDQAHLQIQRQEKQLVETRHVLDKFVGTKASQFATQKGRQAVWEGELTKAIVLFSDVRGFTAMAERLRPQETVRYLNRMFTEFEEVIAFSGGEINKYIGDALLAFFPFPEETAGSAVKKAVLAALRMQDSFHQIRSVFEQNYSEPVHTGLGVGMAAGSVIIGNIGSARRMEFTLIGDTVNFASRLCSIAEDGQTLINQDLALIGEGMFRMEALNPVHIKGKSGTHRPYAVLGEKIQPGLA
jgi:class 3 adenylate cyclase